jgi:Galactose oxidase, central domain
VVDLKRLFLAVVLFSLGVVGVFGSPEARMGAGFVFDDVSGRCVLFGGGYDTGHGMGSFDDMWVLDDGNWSEVSGVGGPFARFNFQMGYSRDHNCVVVFSCAGGGVGDTWEYDVVEEDWSRVRTSGGPVQRGDAGFVYDEGYGVFVMFGGMSDVNPLRVLNETWVYDPSSEAWTEMHPEVCPPRTYGCRFVYDSVNEVNLLWGGNLPGGEGDKLDDFWSYDYGSNTWTLIDTEVKPTKRYWQFMAFDRDAGKVVMFGGRPNYDANLGDTWLYDYAANAWTEVESEVSPPARQSGSMVYDENLGCVVMFGGFEEGMDAVGDTWVFDSGAGEWSLLEDFEVEGSEDVETGIPGFPLAWVCLGLAVFVYFSKFRVVL